MSKPLVDRIPFAKILIALAVVFLVSLGMCGLTGILVMRGGKVPAGMSRFLDQTVGYDMVAMVLSVVGIPVTAVIWVVMTVVSRMTHKDPEPH